MAISSIPSDIFRKAEETDIERIWQIIGQAKAQMQRLGSQQWDENYPAIEHIRQDIQDGNGYVICREDRVVAYGVISFDGEPVYKDIEGKWSNDLPYVIVHRLAIADEMKRQGMAKQFMLQAEEAVSYTHLTFFVFHPSISDSQTHKKNPIPTTMHRNRI